MSDDTPTQRFDAPQGGDGSVPPTTPLPTGGPGVPPPDEQEKRGRGLLIALIVVGAILVIAIIVLAIVLAGGRGTPAALVTTTSGSSVSDSASSTPSETASTPASSAPSPSATKSTGSGGGSASGPVIHSFTANPTRPACPAADATVKGPTDIQFRWSTSNVDSVEFGLIDASGNYQVQSANLPPQGTNNGDLPGSEAGGWAYPCGTDKVTYVLKATGGGKTVTAQVVVDDATYN